MVTASSYVTGRAVGLRGDEAFIDATHLHFTALADLGAGGWDDDLVAPAGPTRGCCPRVLASTDGRRRAERRGGGGLRAAGRGRR